MPRIARLKVRGESTVYHIMSRTALDEYVLGDVEKEFLIKTAGTKGQGPERKPEDRRIIIYLPDEFASILNLFINNHKREKLCPE